jgi:ubiquinone/menaquinone biosynthesis C-methylase UbiE
VVIGERASVKDFYERPEVVRKYGQVGLTAAEAALARRFFPRDASVLDVGAGAGRTAIALAQLGYDVTGVDVSASMIEQARAEAARVDVDARFVEGDAMALPFEDACFDGALFAGNGIGHLELDGMRRCARELARVLRPGGCLVVSARSPYAMNRLLPGLLVRRLIGSGRLGRDESLSEGVFVHRPSLRTLARIFSDAGFVVAGITSHRAAAAEREAGVLTPWVGGQFFIVAVAARRACFPAR